MLKLPLIYTSKFSRRNLDQFSYGNPEVELRWRGDREQLQNENRPE